VLCLVVYTCFAFCCISAVLCDNLLVLYLYSCGGLTAAAINDDYYYINVNYKIFAICYDTFAPLVKVNELSKGN